MPEFIRDLGGGRRKKESVINYEVGVDRLAKSGQKVVVGSTLAGIHAASEAGLNQRWRDTRTRLLFRLFARSSAS